MQIQIRVAIRSIVEYPDIRRNQGIHAHIRCPIHRILPTLPAARLRVGIQGQKGAGTFGTGIANALSHLIRPEIQAGKVPGIGIVTKAEIDGIGAVIYSRFEGWQVASRTHEFHSSHTSSIKKG